ncbi:hypothetical protein FACS1894187_06850 [Synergistales bacterium]|nr:hypothetical protein FACS1894187_06850 [Synergistales bacterium]
MWINTKSGSVVAGNVTKDPEYKRVGNNNTPLFKLSIAIGEDDDGKKKYADIAAWGRLADKLSTLGIQKADSIAAFGIWVKKDSNGKTYWTLKADFVMAFNNRAVAPNEASSGGAQEHDPDDMDFGDLPDFMK